MARQSSIERLNNHVNNHDDINPNKGKHKPTNKI